MATGSFEIGPYLANKKHGGTITMMMGAVSAKSGGGHGDDQVEAVL